jgi:predicted Zn-dependent peptidase
MLNYKNEISDIKLLDIEDLVLDNGVKISMMQFGNLPVVSMQFIINIGAIAESKIEQQWLSSFVANLLKEGSSHYNGQEIVSLLASYGGSIDIHCSDDNLFINIEVLSSFATHAIKIVADILMHPLFPVNEQTRIREDLLRNLELIQVEPQVLTSARLNHLIYSDHPYGREFPQVKYLKKFTSKIAHQFYKSSLNSAETSIYIVGQFNRTAVTHALEKLIGEWHSNNGKKIKSPVIAKNNQWSFIDRENAHQSTLKIAISMNHFSLNDYHALIAINGLLGGTFISRITTNIREDKGYSYSPISSMHIDKKHCFWIQTADVSSEVTQESLTEIFYEINRLSLKPPSKTELSGMVTHLAGLHLIRFATPRSIINQLFFIDKLGLKREFYENYISKLKQLTPKKIIEQMHKSFNENYYIAIAGDKNLLYEKTKSMIEFTKISEFE